MSHPQQYGNYYGSPPPQGHSPQPGYGYGPPPGQYAPPQGQYPPPQQHPGYGTPPPQGHYPPPQSKYGQPSPQPPPGQYPPPAHGYPPQPMQQFPPQTQSPYPPPQPGHGPPQQQYGASTGPPVPPSPGYIPGQTAMGDASRDADALRKAMKGLGTDDTVLINIFSKPDPLQIELLKKTYANRIRRNLEKDVESETSGHYRQGLLALLQGPLMTDVTLVHDAVKGLGTKEKVLDDVLLSRSNADMRAISAEYRKKYGRSLESDVSGDLSLLTKKLFEMVLSGNRAEESTLIIPGSVENDVNRLSAATKGEIDGMAVCSILTSRSDGQLRAINNAFNGRSSVPLDKVIEEKMKSWNSWHTRNALLTIWHRALDRAMYDAKALEDCLSGSFQDDLLVQRLVRIHWDRQHLSQVKGAYRKKFGRDLSDRVREKLSRSKDYRNLMLAILDG